MTADVENCGSRSTDPNHWRNLPIREMTLSLVLVIPCLAHIFAIPFMLYRSAGIVASYNGSNNARPLHIGLVNSTSLPPEIANEDRDIFATWPMDDYTSKAQKRRESKLLFFANMGLGSMIAGLLSDLMGRKSICNIMIALTIVAGFLTTGAPTLGIFQFLWCLIALGTFGTYTATYVRVVEMLPDKVRTPLHLFVFGLSWTAGRAVGLTVAWLTKDWMWIMHWLSIWILVTLLMFYMIPWKFKISEGRRASKDTIWQVFSHKRYLYRLVILCLNWFFLGYIIYTINLSANRLVSHNIYVEMSFKGVMDFLSMSLTVFTTFKYKCTLPLYSSFMFLSGVCYLIMSPFGNVGQVGQAMVHLINFISGGSFGILWITTAYNFPRSFRGTAVGICSIFARIGAASGVYILETVGAAQPVALSVTIGVLVIIVTGSMVLILPERSQKPLLETIQSEDDEIRAEKEAAAAAAAAASASQEQPPNPIDTSGNSVPPTRESTPRLSLIVPDSGTPEPGVPMTKLEPKPSQENDTIMESSDDEETDMPRTDDDSGQETRDRDSMFSAHDDSSSVQSLATPTLPKR
ncbi:putative niacin/nicotinamide transporter NiaP [Tigriopus californicus]|uniref:putative niacin/nicotinamide transporter NiaP n=1 Tax=Tigriopus californicus TaxID=6832 RepID=UPI0027DA8350|nr:putative niacin/nicotinamide transporter NiaP [Tigriopus californicus]